jgi:hypothetical protein
LHTWKFTAINATHRLHQIPEGIFCRTLIPHAAAECGRRDAQQIFFVTLSHIVAAESVNRSQRTSFILIIGTLPECRIQNAHCDKRPSPSQTRAVLPSDFIIVLSRRVFGY